MTVSDLPLFQKWQLRENHIFFALTVIIAVLSGLAAVLFILAIKGTTYYLFGMTPSIARYLMVPTLVSVVAGFLLAKYFPDARGSGVSQTEAAYHLKQGDIPGRLAFGKFLTGTLCIGCGHSMGNEGPSIQIAAALASSIGKRFRLSPERAQSLIPVAAAAALSAAFNTPVAAVIFALEEVIGDMNAALIGSTVVASVTAVIVERSILGNSPIFHVPQYHLVHPAELIAYVVLGVLGGVLSVAFIKGLLQLRVSFRRLPANSRVFQPAIGGAVIGAILIFCPQVMGVGYEFVNQALNGGLVLKTMIILCLVKLAATIISHASGNAGGIFAPSLYIGAMAGGAIGTVMHRFAPFPTGDVGAYALVGMGALFAGIMRAPMTSVFMIFELTQDYQVIVPLMIANMISFAMSKHYQPISLYHALLQQDNVHMPQPGPRVPASAWRARELMTRDFDFLSPHLSVTDALPILANSDARAFLVGSDGSSLGLVTRERIEQAMQSGMGNAAVSVILTRDFEHVHPDHPIELVMERLAKSPGLLPVVSRSDEHRVQGVVTPESILQFLQKSPNGQKATSTDTANSS
jgi:chloride channel protein, CIC family